MYILHNKLVVFVNIEFLYTNANSTQKSSLSIQQGHCHSGYLPP